MRLRRAAAVSLGVGVLLNITVAWSCALWSDVHPKPDNTHSLALPASERQATASALGPFLTRMDGYWPPEPEAFLVLTTFRGVGVTEAHLVASRTKGRDFFGCYWWAGWPLHCLECWMPHGPANAAEWGLALPPFARRNFLSFEGRTLGGVRPPLPLRPMAIGFVVNTLTYAAILLAGLSGVPSIRRSLLRRSGRCQECGYSLVGIATGPCPECGFSESTPP